MNTNNDQLSQWRKSDLSAEERITHLLQSLTLDEKLGQLVGYWFDKRGPGEVVAPMQDTLGAGRPPFDQAAKNGLGHFTRVIGTEPGTTLEVQNRLNEKQRELTGLSRLGLPAIAHEECLTGVNAVGATVYPAPISWGAAFDPELSYEIGAAIGKDLRSLGVHQGLSPVLDVVRDYRWGRVEETIGEDPSLVGLVGAAYAKGLEDNGIIATLKHFVGYSASVSGRNHAPVSAGPREIADILLRPFEIAIRDANVRSVMNSYSDIDGIPVAADRDLLTTLLREEWGFDGTVVSDYWSVPFLITAHGVAANAADAAKLALEAGMDVELPDGMCYPKVAELVRSGELDEKTIDQAVRRVLQHKLELGLLDDLDFSPQQVAPDLDTESNRAIAKKAADSSLVLLRNTDNLLPLPANFSGRIAVVGPAAAEPRVLLGCYSYPVHVLPRYPEFGLGLPVQSILDALRTEFPNADIQHATGASFFDDDSGLTAAAVQMCEDADLIIVAVGDLPGMFGRGTSGEGCDAVDLTLPGDQAALVDAISTLDIPKVLLTNSGRPYAFQHSAEEYPAALQTFIPGAEGAQAIAGALSGRVNPNGKLPVQIPKTPGGAQHLYLGGPLTRSIDKISSQSTAPMFAFGHGLSYTTFELSDVAISHGSLTTSETAQLTVTIENTGSRSGAEVIQLYLHDPVARVVRPIQQLVGFAKVHLAPGERAKATFTVSADLSSYSDSAHTRVVDAGELKFGVGTTSAKMLNEVTVTITDSAFGLTIDRMITAPVTVETLL